MQLYNNLYCKIYLDTDIDEKSLINLITKTLSGKKEIIRTVSTKLCEIDIVFNEDFDEKKRNLDEIGFLYSRYYLDISPKDENVDQKNYIHNIGYLLEKLWGCNFRAIASCDFEEKLPKKDDFKS